MQNYMRTILSGLQNWINKRLHETVPETNKAHMQLIKDENGATSWEERTHYKEVTTQEVVNLELTKLTPVDENGNGVQDDGQYALMTPWAVDLVAGGMYTVTYNGESWDCYGIDGNEIEAGGSGIVVLGNVEAMGVSGVEGGNPDAPFVFLCISNSSEFVSMMGSYGMFINFSSDYIDVEVSVRGVVTTTTYKELEEGYLPESVRNGGGKQITIAIDEYDNVNTGGITFDEAWAMPLPQLQAAIEVKTPGFYMYDERVQSPVLVSKFENTSYGTQEIRIQYQECLVDPGDLNGTSKRILHWEKNSIYIDQFIIPGVLTTSFFYDDCPYPVLQGTNFTGVSAENFKDGLGIVDPVFVVTVDNVVNNVGTADKSLAEIKAAHDAGQVVLCKYGEQYHSLIQCYSDSVSFVETFCAVSVILGREIKITENDATVREHWIELGSYVNNAIKAALPTPSTADAGKILRVNSAGKYELVSDEPKQYVSLADATTGDVYRITINNGTLVSTLVEEAGANE